MIEYKKIRLLITRNGKTKHAISDLVYIQNVPHVVLRWCLGPGVDIVPELTVALDSSKLHLLKFGEAQYMYELAVVWPEKES